ncbi:hypothetical protein O6H91_08G114200 [Diphasiastrum complanatum]|uniref:Uncharacterized protein n=1 Tax=Diphasiastrum complanatum TaxID=34168 RepID=A0ACC2D180_DIPCM|nr:hypothetical protein O6H91_08G114200 [Diphasiastrum complanatum]
MAHPCWSSSGHHETVAIALLLLFLGCYCAPPTLAFLEARDENPVTQQTFWSELWKHSWTLHTGGAQTRRRLKLASAVETDVNKATAITPRRDPLAGFELFTGGFNVSNRHYWSSVAFTGVWGYTLAVICFLFGLLTLMWHCCCWLCGYKRSRKKSFLAKSEMFRHLQFFCVFQFTACALISVAVIYWGNENMGKELKETSHLLVDTSSKVLNQVESALGTVDAATAPLDDTDMVKEIKAGCRRLNYTAHIVGRKIETTKIKIHTISKLVKLALTVTASVMTFLLFAGLVSAWCGWREILMMIFALMTILLFVSWLLSSVSYVLSKILHSTGVETTI